MNSIALPPADAPLDERLFSRARAGACVGAVALVSLLAFEAVAVSAAMPAVAQALGGFDLYALAFGGMLATSVLGMVLAGIAIDRHGALWPSVVGLVVFLAGLLLAGAADRMGLVVAGRIVQGLGGGMLGVALYAGMGQLVPPALHPRLFSLFATAWVLPGLLGPVCAAWLVGQLGWRAVFLAVAMVLPLVALLLLPAFGRLPRPTQAPAASTASTPRTALAWAGLGALGALALHGASQAQSLGARMAWLALGLGAAGAAAWRLLPRGSLVAAPGLPAVIALRGLLAAAFGSAEVFIPLWLNRGAGWTLAEAGLALSAGAVSWSAGSALQARLVAARTRQLGLQAGFVAVATGLAAIALQGLTHTPAGWVVPAWAVTGFGIGLGFPILSVLTLARSAPHEQGRHASALQLSDALCSSATLALAGILFNLAGADGGAAAFVPVWLLALVLAVAGALLARRAFAQ